MKKKITSICIVLSLLLCFISAVACERKHAHTFAKEWSSDSEYHWRSATCEHTDEVSDKAKHAFNGEGKCSVCGYDKSHGGSQNDGHTHTFADTWSNDRSNHWHAATCEHTDQTADKGAHSFDKSGKCTICNYTTIIEPTKQLQYELNEDGESYAVKGLNDEGAEVTDVIIPSTYEGKPVTIIAEGAFKNNKKLEYVSIPKTITEICDDAFRSISSSTLDITIAEGSVLKRICKNDFRSTYITGINVPKTVETIDDYAFYICNKLYQVTFEQDSQLTTIGQYAFANVLSLYSIVIPESVTTIGQYAFYLSRPLTLYCKVGEKQDGWHKNWNYNNLQPVVWNCDSNKVADDGYTYYVADNGLHFALKDGVAEIAPCKKYNLYGITTLPEKITFENQDYIVKSIRANGFQDNPNIITITMPDSITELNRYAFANCKNLKSIKLSSNIKEIGSYAFSECESLLEIELPKNTTKIYSYAFDDCTALSKVTLPKNAYINACFSNCTSLSKITIPIGTSYIGWNCFKGCDNLSIECEAPSKPTMWSSDWNSENRPVQWGCAGVNSTSEYKYVVSDNEVYLTEYLGSATNITVPSTIDDKSVVSIGECFKGRSTLVAITLPSTLKVISGYAFYNCSSLENIRIPDSVTVVDNYAFSGCSGLTKIITPANLTTVGERAFENCSGLTSLYFPASVVNVGYYALNGVKYPFRLYSGAASRPSGWDSNYSPTSSRVTWNHDGSEINE